MSNRSSLRPLKLLDYKTLSNSGNRVYKGERNLTDMSVQKIQDSEHKISSKIKRFLDENDISEFFDLDEIESSAGSLRELLENFEGLHIELKRELEDKVYSETYKDYDETISKISKWLKDSKAEIRKRKSQVLDREKDKLRVEEEFFRSRISRDLDSLEAEKSVFIDDLERHAFAAKDLMKSYSEIFLRIKEHSLAFATEFQDLYDDQIRTLDEFIQSRRKTITDIKLAEKAAESDRRRSEEKKMSDEKKIRDDEAILVCRNINSNICERIKGLEEKCKVKIESHSDVQVMDLKKDFIIQAILVGEDSDSCSEKK